MRIEYNLFFSTINILFIFPRCCSMNERHQDKIEFREVHKQLVKRQDQVILRLFAKTKNKNDQKDCSFLGNARGEDYVRQKRECFIIKKKKRAVYSTLRHARDSSFYSVETICGREADGFLSQHSLTPWTSYIKVWAERLQVTLWQKGSSVLSSVYSHRLDMNNGSMLTQIAIEKSANGSGWTCSSSSTEQILKDPEDLIPPKIPMEGTPTCKEGKNSSVDGGMGKLRQWWKHHLCEAQIRQGTVQSGSTLLFSKYILDT